MAMVQSEVACGMICRNSGERAGGGCCLLRACLDRPHGASPHTARARPRPLAKEACGWQCFANRNLFSNSKHALVHSMTRPRPGPRALLFGGRKRADSRAPGAFRRGVNPCAEVMRGPSRGQSAAGVGLKCGRLPGGSQAARG